jgi:hypothetical protein
MRACLSVLGAMAGLASAAVGSLHAQSVASRVASAGDGAVTFQFTSRPGVCGDGEHFIRTGSTSYHGSFHSGRSMEPCVFGPVQVRLTRVDGAVTRVQTWVGPVRERQARDLGAVSAPDAARYLMSIAARGAPHAGARAILPAVLADSAVVWPELLAIARDTETRSRGTRREALMWLSRFASGAIAGRPNDPFVEDDDPRTEDEDLRIHAVFVLSQLRNGAGIPDLIDIARNNRSTRVRSQALFWLGQSGSPRALELFEAVLKS